MQIKCKVYANEVISRRAVRSLKAQTKCCSWVYSINLMYFWFNWTFLNKWRILTDLLWSACKKQHRIGILYLHMSLAAEVMAAIRCWTNMSWSGSTGSEQKVQFNKRLGLSHRAAVVCSSSAPRWLRLSLLKWSSSGSRHVVNPKCRL